MMIGGEPCTCGNRGCLERYCSATALIRMGREAVKNRPNSLILEKAGGDPARITARTVIDSAREKDPAASEVFSRYVGYLAQAVANVVNFLDPEMIVLGGGVSKAGMFLLQPVRDEFPEHVIFRDRPMPSLDLAILGDEAGIVGAAMLC